MELSAILNKASETSNLSREEIVRLLALEDDAETKSLFRVADAVRRESVGDDVHIRGLIEFSNYCARNCSYCGLHRDNHKIHRYRMGIDEIVEVASNVVRKGIGTIVLQSGEDPWFTADRVAEIVRGIKSNEDCAITLSIGERSFDDYKIMKEAGADRYLLRHEAANPELYGRLHPGMTLDTRIRCLHDLRALGYQVGAGCMVGLPGQTLDDLATDIIFVRDIGADMVGIGPFIPHPDTPLHEFSGGTLDMTLKMVALARIVTRDAHLPATTAVGSIDEFGREKALMCGANVVMPNYTPLKYRIDYEIYPNKRCISEDPAECHGCMKARIAAIHRTVGVGPGHSLKMTK